MSADPAPPGVGAQETEITRRAADLLTRTRAELERADAKASILLGGLLALSGGVSALLSTAKWNPLTQPVSLQVGWWAAMIATIVALAALARAVYPRGHRPDPDRSVVGYFGDVVRFSSVQALATALATGPDEQTAIVDQVWQLSLLVQSKYRLIRHAIIAFSVAILLLFVVLFAALAA